MKIKKLACVLSFVGISISSMKAQSNVVSTGGDAYSSASGSVSYTIGQLDFQFHAGSGGNGSEGVQQAYLIQSNGLLNPEQMQVSIWPNPTSDLVNIQIQESMLNRTLFIFDAQGKCVLNQLLSNLNTSLDLASFASGLYTLCIDTENNAAFKITKTP
jgi:hypothetical protein